MSETPTPSAGRDFELERYKFILQQLHTVNDNVHKFLSVFQTIVTALLGAAIGLFVGYRNWNISPAVAESGIEAIMWLVTLTSIFTVLLIVAGVFSWLDYRKEECEILESRVGSNFRSAPTLRNFWRWYETYVVLFIILGLCFLWFYVHAVVMPSIK